MASSADKKEPAPIKTGGKAIQDLVIEDLPIWKDARLIADLEARKAYGLNKYGTLLQAHNGRDATMDAYQEALDLIVYLRQCVEEGQLVMGEYLDAIDIARSLRARLDAKR